VAVAPDHRGAGVGQRLVTAITRQLLERSSAGRVALTVADRRTPARALYEGLGFRPDGSFVGYRSWGDR
jgi:ribosomal protein S18 acetylase RimI-like enzyme